MGGRTSKRRKAFFGGGKGGDISRSHDVYLPDGLGQLDKCAAGERYQEIVYAIAA